MEVTTRLVEAIVKTIEGQKRFAQDMQPTLKKYVRDKSFPLASRFAVWSAYCDKQVGGWCPGTNEFGIIGKMVNACDPMDYDRYATYSWDWFLDAITEDDELREKYGVTVDEFKEQLIETNFGSFDMDW